MRPRYSTGCSLIGAALLLGVLGGCAIKKPATIAPAVTPAAPKPQAPTVPPAVIGTQNTALIPPQQPVPPEAIPTHPLPPPPPLTSEREPVTPQHPPSRPPTSPSSPPRPVAEAPVAAPATPENATEQPVLPRLAPSRQVEVRSAGEISGTLKEVNDLVRQLNAARLAGSRREALAQVRSLVRLSEDAIKRGDLSQADDLANRAATIARDLASHR